jgi:hypothetical protein
MLCKKGGSGNRMSKMKHKLPMNFPNHKDTCVISDGLTNLPKSVGPVTEAIEKLIVTSLFTNIKEMLAVYLDSDPVSSRTQANSNKECLEFLVIGCSHASMLAEQLNSLGARCQKLILCNYRASNIHVGKLEDGLKGITVNPSTVVVVQLFDNGVYMAATEEGGLIPLSKSIDGKYHCFGDLTFAPKEWQWKLFQQVAVELKSLKNHNIIFLAPLPRYLEEGCCDNPGHMPNRSKPNYKKNMEDSVYQSRSSIKDFAFRMGFRRMKVLSSWGIVKKDEAAWKDPVHLETKSYLALARAVMGAHTNIEVKRKGEANLASEAKRPRIEESSSYSAAAPARGGGRRGGRGGVQDRRQFSSHQPGNGDARGGGWERGNRGWNRGQRPGGGAASSRYN